jgi:signal transduction histidine kinase
MENFVSEIESEKERLKIIEQLYLLETRNDESLSKITRLASILFDVPVALVSLVDKTLIRFIGRHGTDINDIPRELGLCGLAIQSDELYIVEDASTDYRTREHPWIKQNAWLFYAAVPLKIANGGNIGTLCIVDNKARLLSAKDRVVLKQLSEIVVTHIQDQQKNLDKIREVLHMAAHELKNPLTPIPIWAEMIQTETSDSKVKQLAAYIQRSSSRMFELIKKSLENATVKSNNAILNITPVDLSAITTRIATANVTQAANKNQRIYLNIEDGITIGGDELQISEVVDNLISNAIKYSGIDTAVNIHLILENNHAILKVIDEGPGLMDADFSKVFLPFSKLSAKPTAGELSTGLGLSIVKQIVEEHKGKVWCENNASGKGASFIVRIPVLRD